MTGKRLFDGGDTVTTFTGLAGIVIPEEAISAIRTCTREGKKPGHYFAPGCCRHPDYVMQVPVLFEDGTYDVMRAMNIKKAPNLPKEKRSCLQSLIREHTG
jgi:hypothetical protein